MQFKQISLVVSYIISTAIVIVLFVGGFVFSAFFLFLMISVIFFGTFKVKLLDIFIFSMTIAVFLTHHFTRKRFPERFSSFKESNLKNKICKEIIFFGCSAGFITSTLIFIKKILALNFNTEIFNTLESFYDGFMDTIMVGIFYPVFVVSFYIILAILSLILIFKILNRRDAKQIAQHSTSDSKKNFILIGVLGIIYLIAIVVATDITLDFIFNKLEGGSRILREIPKYFIGLPAIGFFKILFYGEASMRILTKEEIKKDSKLTKT
ncbi:MAG: hypothetical protein N3E38_00580 [Candidatus Aenigmarchaeota archaeon]|nr:hypothetical protein [Candidatus Aenigmarchaeota archaeon]